MAPNLVSAGYWARFLVEDNGGNRVQVVYQLQNLSAADAHDIYEVFEPLVSGSVVTMTIELRFVIEDFEQPTGEAQVEVRAKLRVRDTGTKLRTLYIPSPEPSLFLTDSGDGANVVDPENSDLLAFLAVFEASGKAYLPGAHISAADGFDSGVRTTRTSKRG